MGLKDTNQEGGHNLSLFAEAKRSWSTRTLEVFTIIAAFWKDGGIRCAPATPMRKVCVAWGQKSSISLW